MRRVLPIGLAGGLCMLPYAAGLFAQAPSPGGRGGEAPFPPAALLLQFAEDNLPLILILGFVFCLIFFGWLMVKYDKDPPPPPEPSPSDTFGTADYAPQWTGIPHPYYPLGGVFFGKSSLPGNSKIYYLDQDPGAPVCSTPENHVLIVAKTRTGKGTRVIVPTLLRYAGSVLVIDPKGGHSSIGQILHVKNQQAQSFQQHVNSAKKAEHSLCASPVTC